MAGGQMAMLAGLFVIVFLAGTAAGYVLVGMRIDRRRTR